MAAKQVRLNLLQKENKIDRQHFDKIQIDRRKEQERKTDGNKERERDDIAERQKDCKTEKQEKQKDRKT